MDVLKVRVLVFPLEFSVRWGLRSLVCDVVSEIDVVGADCLSLVPLSEGGDVLLVGKELECFLGSKM